MKWKWEWWNKVTFKAMKRKILHSIKKPKIYIPLIVLIIIVGLFLRKGSSTDTFIEVSPQQFVQQVSVAGKVIAAQDVNLGFEGSGKVSGVYANVGDKVYQGQLLASIGSGDLQASLLQRQARLEAEEAKLSDLKKGKRPEEIAVSQSAVLSAKTSLDQAKESMIDTLSDSYTLAEDIIHNKVDQFIGNGRTDTPRLTFSVSDSMQKYDIESNRVKIEVVLKLWQTLVANLSTSNNLTESMSDSQINLNMVNTFLLKISSVVNNLSTDYNPNLSQTTIDKYKSDISIARTNLRTAIGAVTSGETQIKNAETALVTAENKLKLDQAGYVKEDIDAQMAQVKAAQADVDSVRAQIAKTVIVAPFVGVVTKMDLNVGEIVSSLGSSVSLISSARYEIESYVPEVNIALIKLKSKAKISLDAYGNDTKFDAVLSEINPAETIKDGVSTYKIKLQFTADDERIRPGMTANITISTDQRNDVIAIAPKALIKRDGKTFVLKKVDKEIIEQEVTTGAVSFDGKVEIVSGLKDGDTVVIKASK